MITTGIDISQKVLNIDTFSISLYKVLGYI